VVWCASVGACILTHRGPTSPKRHAPPAGTSITTGALSITKSRKTVDVQNRALDDDPPNMRSLLQANLRDAAPRRRMRWQWLLEAASSLGIDQAEFEQGIPGGYEALLRQAGAEQGIDGKWRGRSCAGAWMFVSGLTHPSLPSVSMPHAASTGSADAFA
jgi:hypothetical protein